ncbi:MAG: hypothetical protein ABI047_05505 [Jatrophihabitantaceae bacterium]
MGLPYTELDSLFHGPGWVPRPELLDDVRTVVAGDSWVSEWQYPDARPLLLARADTLIWLDFRRRTVMHRVLRRSLRRALLRQRTFNDNTEGFAPGSILGIRSAGRGRTTSTPGPRRWPLSNSART